MYNLTEVIHANSTNLRAIFRSIARTDLDISYITSRLIVMPYPSEGLESAYKTNHIDDVRVRYFLYIAKR